MWKRVATLSEITFRNWFFPYIHWSLKKERFFKFLASVTCTYLYLYFCISFYLYISIHLYLYTYLSISILFVYLASSLSLSSSSRYISLTLYYFPFHFSDASFFFFKFNHICFHCKFSIAIYKQQRQITERKRLTISDESNFHT